MSVPPKRPDAALHIFFRLAAVGVTFISCLYLTLSFFAAVDLGNNPGLGDAFSRAAFIAAVWGAAIGSVTTLIFGFAHAIRNRKYRELAALTALLLVVVWWAYLAATSL